MAAYNRDAVNFDYRKPINDREMDRIWRAANPMRAAKRFAEELYGSAHEWDPDFINSLRAMNSETATVKADYPGNLGIGRRVETVVNLLAIAEREGVGVSQDRTQRLLEKLAYIEEQPSPYAVNLGIEVEVYLASVTPPEELRDQMSEEDYAELMLAWRHRAIQSEAAGVPYTHDALWEFGHKPAHHYLTLSREVQALMRLSLINPDYSRHGLHITIGGVSTRYDNGPQVLARALEGAGWCSSSLRILSPGNEKDGVGATTLRWACKGVAGVKERNGYEIEEGDRVAVEIRTLQLKSMAGLDRTLRSAYALGAALKAHQTPGALSRPEGELAAVWSQFSSGLDAIYEQYGMDAPSKGWRANGHGDREINEPTHFALTDNFKRLGALLKQAERDPASEGAKFQNEVQRLVILSRGVAMAILNRTRPAPQPGNSPGN